MLALAGAGSAIAVAGTPSTGTVSIPQGASAAALPGARKQAATDPNTPMQVSFILKIRGVAALEKKVEAGWSGKYLSTKQFASKYGQPRSVTAGIVSYLAGYHITSKVYADRLDISTNGTAGEYEKALSVGLNDYRVTESNGSGRGTHTALVHAAKRDPELPRSASGSDLGSAVLAILGLSNYSPFASNAVAHRSGVHGTLRSRASGSLPPGELAPSDFAARYKLSALTNAGAEGQGRTIGIVTLASFVPSTPVAFWNDYLGLDESTSRIHVVTLDGGAGAPSAKAGSDETDLDVEQSGALAPGADVRVYVAPNTDPGFADAFYSAASQNVADSVSASWGESETYVDAAVASGTETPAYEASYDQAFLENAAQGQSAFVSAGDYGAYTAAEDLGTTNLSVDTPGSSPYVTSAGGTTLPSTQTVAEFDSDGNPTGASESAVIPSEISWSWDYLWPLYGALGAPSAKAAGRAFNIGGGGGYSSDEPRPSYQSDISDYQFSPYLSGKTPEQVAPGVVEPTKFQVQTTPGTGSASTPTGRGEPDVSANADPDTGYAVYDPTIFASTDGFAQYGGTSFVAPQLNGSTAVIDSALGGRVGFWNPQVYGFARSTGSPFTPINDTQHYSGIGYLYATSSTGTKTALPGSLSNNNLYYTGNPGSYWNPASGLGTPNLATLASDFRNGKD